MVCNDNLRPNTRFLLCFVAVLHQLIKQVRDRCQILINRSTLVITHCIGVRKTIWVELITRI